MITLPINVGGESSGMWHAFGSFSTEVVVENVRDVKAILSAYSLRSQQVSKFSLSSEKRESVCLADDLLV